MPYLRAVGGEWLCVTAKEEFARSRQLVRMRRKRVTSNFRGPSTEEAGKRGHCRGETPRTRPPGSHPPPTLPSSPPPPLPQTSTLAASIPATSAATCVSFSENGYHFASGDADGSVTVWDLRKQKAIATVAAGGAVAQVAFDGCGKYLGYAGAGGAGAVVVKEWGTEVMKLDAKKKGYSGFAWGKDARSVVAASERVVAVYSE